MWLSCVVVVLTLIASGAVATGDDQQLYLSIDQFGAVPNNNSLEAALANGVAVLAAMQAANQGLNGTRTVLIPGNNNYYMLPANHLTGFDSMSDITLDLQGTVWAWTDEVDKWPVIGSALNLFQFTNCTNIRLTGTGVVEGQGYWWWWYVIVSGHDDRPILLQMNFCENITIEGWTLRNSPRYHIYLGNVRNVFVYNVTIHVDVEDQAKLLHSFGLMTTEGDGSGLPAGIPTFPLNTDGIDVAGVNITVQHCRIQNFDDSVCLKPSHMGDMYGDCTENVLFEDIEITYGVGASVGSVPPSLSVACIRNSTFRDIRFYAPIKAIYVKPNPGTSGSGIIDGITYENVVATNALWWSIWVSTQQQHQPGGGADTHCSFLYPLWNSTCATQPLVPVTNLVLRNITMTGALLSPGILRCNDSGPCHGWLFENVHISSLTNFPVGDAFDCAGIIDSTGIDVSPSVSTCFTSGNQQESVQDDVSSEHRSGSHQLVGLARQVLPEQ